MQRPSSIWQGTRFALAFALCWYATSATAQVPLVAKLFSTKVAADPKADYKLTEEHGPWLILAASFGGDEGVAQARQLVLELRGQYNLPAYSYSTEYDFTGRPDLAALPGMNMKYARQERYAATAVLVGDYSTADDARMQETLEKLKYMRPQALDYSKTGKTAQRMVVVREYLKKLSGDSEKGPMAAAFVTRNPLLPEEYFTAPQVDAFVRSLNANVEHSLLQCRGNFTVVVRTFEGASAVDFGKGARASQLDPSADRMDRAADLAHRLTMALRKEGVEAYEFHDRFRSLVCVGCFEKLGTPRADGSFNYDPAITATMEKYAAGNQMEMTALGPGLRANGRENIPFDLQPAPIAVPKSDRRSIYSGKWLSSR